MSRQPEDCTYPECCCDVCFDQRWTDSLDKIRRWADVLHTHPQQFKTKGTT
jgi:hypothetical protein